MIDLFPNWRNAPHCLDVSYTEASEVPLLAAAIKERGSFWDGKYWYSLSKSGHVKRWPDWRNKQRLPSEKHEV